MITDNTNKYFKAQFEMKSYSFLTFLSTISANINNFNDFCELKCKQIYDNISNDEDTFHKMFAPGKICRPFLKDFTADQPMRGIKN